MDHITCFSLQCMVIFIARTCFSDGYSITYGSYNMFLFAVYGGIYLDFDEIVLRSVDNLRTYEYTQVTYVTPLK